MSSFLMIGRRLIPREQVALVEAFVPDASPNLQTTRDFRSRVVMINRDSILTELTPEGFAKEHGFRLLADEMRGHQSGRAISGRDLRARRRLPARQALCHTPSLA